MQRRSGSSVGLASVLMIVMILALTCFGVLALTSARADAAVSGRAGQFSAEYYAAEGRLQRQLAGLDAQRAGGSSLREGGTIRLTEPMDEERELCMEVLVLPNGQGCKVLCCELAHTGAWQPEEAPMLWNGGE